MRSLPVASTPPVDSCRPVPVQTPSASSAATTPAISQSWPHWMTVASLSPAKPI